MPRLNRSKTHPTRVRVKSKGRMRVEVKEFSGKENEVEEDSKRKTEGR